MNLTEAIAAHEDQDEEPARCQRLLYRGRLVMVLAVLDRTAVLELSDERRLVRHDELQVPDPDQLRWQAREQHVGQAKPYAIRGARARTAAARRHVQP